MRILFKYIICPIAEICLYAGVAILYLFLCVHFLGDLYGILAVFLSVGLGAVFVSIFGGK